MTHQNDYRLPPAIVEEIARLGLDGIPEMLTALIKSAVQAERSRHLLTGQLERTEKRKGHSNGYKPRIMRTHLEALGIAKKLRNGNFFCD